MTSTYAELTTQAIINWLNNHRAAIAAGMNVGQLDRDKAQQFRLELAKRSGEDEILPAPRPRRVGQLPF